MTKKVSQGFLFFLALAAVSSVPIGSVFAEQAGVTSATLREQTREDISASYQILREHHPGVHNPFDPKFASRLEKAKDRALLESERVLTAEDRVLAIEVINQMLGDGHARIQVGYNGSLGDWPRFSAAWRGDGLYVTSSLDAVPVRGAKLLSCDGQEARSLIKKEMLRTLGRPNEAGQWWVFAGNYFNRGKLSAQPAPANCQFVNPDRTIANVPLKWEPYPNEEFERQIASAQPQPVGMARLPEGIRWITLSSFSPDASQIAEYKKIFDALDAQPPEFQGDRTIVLDLRGNKGGSSTWPQKVAEHIWGKQAVDWALADYFRHTEVWYLADSANIAHFRNAAEKMRERGLVDLAEWAEGLSNSLQSTSAKGQRFFREPYGKQLLSSAKPTTQRRTPPIYVVIDGGCVSACLDAVDIFTRFRNVKLVGAPTSADTEYLEIRRQRLPSGRGSVILPTKIWINRPRKAGQVYHPDVMVTDLDWTTSTMVSRILKDLKKRH